MKDEVIKLLKLKNQFVEIKCENRINGLISLTGNEEELRQEIKKLMQINIDMLDVTISVISYCINKLSKEKNNG